MEEIHPTQDERAAFDSTGYLRLDAFLADDLVSKLLGGLHQAIDRRRADAGPDGQLPGRSPGKQTTVTAAGRRIFHILDDDPAFLDLIDHESIMPYVRGLLHETPHFHASDAIWEEEVSDRQAGWHIDGADNGYRTLRPQIPLLQLKVGYYLSDMSEPNQGNLLVVPGSHRDDGDPTPEQLAGFKTLPGAMQVCGPPGTAIIFHNALWHSQGPQHRPGGRRIMLYYAYEVPWLIGNPEHWSYPPEFYTALSPERRKLFHGFVFAPQEYRFA